MIKHSVFSRCVLAVTGLLLALNSVGCDRFKKKSDSVTLGLSEGETSDLAYTFVPVFNALPYATKSADLQNPGVQYAMDMIEDFAQFAYVECHSTSRMSANLWVLQLEQDSVMALESAERRVFVDEERNIFVGSTDTRSTKRPSPVNKLIDYPCVVMPQRFLSSPSIALMLDSLTNARAASQEELATAQYIYLAMRGYEQAGDRGLTMLQQAYIKIATSYSKDKDATTLYKQLQALDRDLNPCSADAPSARYAGEAAKWRNNNFRCFDVEKDKGVRGYAAITSDFKALRITVLKRLATLHAAAYPDVASAPTIGKIWAALTYSDDLANLASSKAPEAEAAKLLLGKDSQISWSSLENDTYAAASSTNAGLTEGFGLTGGNEISGNALQNRRVFNGQARCGCPQSASTISVRGTPAAAQQGQRGYASNPGQGQRGTVPNQGRGTPALGSQGSTLSRADADTLRQYNFAAQNAPKAGDNSNQKFSDAVQATANYQKPNAQYDVENNMRSALKAAAEGKAGESNGMRVMGIQNRGTKDEYAVAEFKTAAGTAYAYQTKDGRVTTQTPVAADSTAGKAMANKTPAGAVSYATKSESTVFNAKGESVAGTGVTWDPKKPNDTSMFIYSTTGDGKQTAEKLPTNYDAKTNTYTPKASVETTSAIAKVAAQGSDSKRLQSMEDALCAKNKDINTLADKKDAVNKAEAEVAAAKEQAKKDGLTEEAGMTNYQLSQAEAKLAEAKKAYSEGGGDDKLKTMQTELAKDKETYRVEAKEANAKLDSAVGTTNSGIKWQPNDEKDPAKGGKYVAVDEKGEPRKDVPTDLQTNLDSMTRTKLAADGRCATRGAGLTGFALDDGCSLADTKPEAAKDGSGVGAGSGTGTGTDAVASALNPDANKQTEGKSDEAAKNELDGPAKSASTDASATGSEKAASSSAADLAAATKDGTAASASKETITPGAGDVTQPTKQDFTATDAPKTDANPQPKADTPVASADQPLGNGTTNRGDPVAAINPVSPGNEIGAVTKTEGITPADPLFQTEQPSGVQPAPTVDASQQYGKEGGLIGPALPEGYQDPMTATNWNQYAQSANYTGGQNAFPEANTVQDPAYSQPFAQDGGGAAVLTNAGQSNQGLGNGGLDQQQQQPEQPIQQQQPIQHQQEVTPQEPVGGAGGEL